MSFIRGLFSRSKSSSKIIVEVDLCFTDETLSQAFADASASTDALCAVLWRACSTPHALSICRSAPGQGTAVLPPLLAAVRAAAATITSDDSSWRDAGGAAAALVHATASLCARLAATPQHRRLLLQHGLPGALAAAAAALAARAPSLGGSERAAALASLEASVVCFGCLWQPGFAAVHAPPAAAAPAALRLPREVEELLRRHEEPANNANSSRASGEPSELPETPLAALLAALRAAAAVRRDAAASSAAWRAALNLQRIAAAAAAALLAFAPATEARFLQSGGLTDLLALIGEPPEATAGSDLGAAARRRALMTAAQAVAAVLQPAAAREAVVWREQLRAGGGVRGVGALVAFAIASAEVPSLPDGDGVADSSPPPREAAPADASEASSSYRRWSQVDGASFSLTLAEGPAATALAERAAAADAAEAAAPSVERLREWFVAAMPPPATPRGESRAVLDVADDLAAAETSLAADAPELAALLAFLRNGCDACAAPPPATPPTTPPATAALATRRATMPEHGPTRSRPLRRGVVTAATPGATPTRVGGGPARARRGATGPRSYCASCPCSG